MIMDRWLLDLVDNWQGFGILLYILLTTVISGVLSAAIGLERQLRGEPAGVRTHVLIAIASCLLMTISIWAIRMADGSMDPMAVTVPKSLNYDTARIAAAAVTGIGFLGGGVIIHDKFSVRGLSTAATLWICTALGLACGAGFIVGSLITTLVVLVVLLSFNRTIAIFYRKSPSILVVSKSGVPIAEEIRNMAELNGLALQDIVIQESSDTETVVSVIFRYKTKKAELDYACRLLKKNPDVLTVKNEYRN